MNLKTIMIVNKCYVMREREREREESVLAVVCFTCATVAVLSSVLDYHAHAGREGKVSLYTVRMKSL